MLANQQNVRPGLWEGGYERSLGLYEARYPEAGECVRRDHAVLFTLCDLPAAHWVHLCTTDPIE